MSISDPFQTLTIEETFKHLKTSAHGLSSQEVKRRIESFGKNIIAEEKINKIRIFLRQFSNILICILFAASLISISIGEWTDFLVINFIIVSNGLIGFWQELKAETSIVALKKLTESRNKVMRDGNLGLVNSSELVPGDYLIFHEGEVVTADIRLVESTGLMLDESTITGESTPTVKDHTSLLSKAALPYELSNMVLAGSIVVRGTGRGIVVKTGSNTYLATIAEKAKEISPETPLIKSLGFFAKKYVILLIALFASLGFIGHLLQGRPPLELAYILLAGLVSAVPEGLPIVITLVMVIGAIALSKRQTLIRYLPSVETLGSATVIASDKTGTITEGKLITKEVYASDLVKLKIIAALCNDSHEGSGDPLDVALSDWVENYEEIRKNCPRKWAYSFDARLMLMATVNEINGKEELLVKGAYESLKEKAENKEELKEFEAVLHSFVKEGLRVLAFGAGEWVAQEPSFWKIKIIGLIGFFDPPKQGVKEAVFFAKKAGIRVLMITGDHAMTAKMVAKEIGIWSENDLILTGKEIEGVSDERLIEELKHATVLARILPEHKYRVVKLLQKSGEIVAVTGDGINDVPALKVADIGIAMGEGTEAAKSASRMIIADNNLKVIVEAVRNARVIADNIRKVLYYLISTSLQEISMIFLAMICSLPLPLAAIQILWINIVTDGVQDKAFPFAKEEGNVMTRKPRKSEKQFFDGWQIFRILSFGITLGLFCFFLYWHLLDLYPFKTVTTIVFTSVVVAQWANGIQAQKEIEPFFKNILNSFAINPFIFLGLGFGIILQCLAIYIVPDLFHSTPMSLEQWKYPLFVFLAAFGAVEIRKWVELFLRKALS
jgi:P-type Ca2+ transporter type 2C